MYKVLIVDDELIERKGLEKILQKNFSDQLIIETASNGKKAIEKSKKFKPNIIFMDIKMPGIDGIETMKIIKELFSDIYVIIISAFDSFKYAQEALNNDAYEYLLKPVKRIDIINSVKKIISIEEKKIKKIEYQNNLEKVNSQSINILKDNFVEYLINNNQEKMKQLLNLNIEELNIQPGVVVILDLKENKNAYNYIKDFFNSITDHFLIKKKKNYCVVFFKKEQKVYKSFFQQLYREIFDLFSIEAEIKFEFYDSIKDSYNAYYSVLKKIYNDELIIKSVDYPIELENELINKIQLNIIEEAFIILDKIFIWIKENLVEKEYQVRYLIELETLINRILYKKLDNKELLIPLNQSENIENMSLNKMKKLLKNRIDLGIKKILENNTSTVEEIVNKAKKYISKNYMNDITLDLVASEMCVSSYYFSKLFKKESGINFIEYLTEVRINNAKYMIRNTNKSIKHIAREIGYNDPNYFSRVFKKETGYSPSKFKKI